MHFPKQVNTRFDSLLFIREGAILKRIDVHDIKWVHSDGNYITIHTSDQRFVLKMSLKKICERLPDHLFVRVHRSYVLQVSLIERIDFQESEIHLTTGDTFPLGRGYKSELMDQIDLLN